MINQTTRVTYKLTAKFGNGYAKYTHGNTYNN